MDTLREGRAQVSHTQIPRLKRILDLVTVCVGHISAGLFMGGYPSREAQDCWT